MQGSLHKSISKNLQLSSISTSPSSSSKAKTTKSVGKPKPRRKRKCPFILDEAEEDLRDEEEIEEETELTEAELEECLRTARRILTSGLDSGD